MVYPKQIRFFTPVYTAPANPYVAQYPFRRHHQNINNVYGEKLYRYPSKGMPRQQPDSNSPTVKLSVNIRQPTSANQ